MGRRDNKIVKRNLVPRIKDSVRVLSSRGNGFNWGCWLGWSIIFSKEFEFRNSGYSFNGLATNLKTIS